MLAGGGIYTHRQIDNWITERKKKKNGSFSSRLRVSGADLRIPPSHDFAVQDYCRLGL